MMSNAAALRARSVAALASSFRMKHSSPVMIFSPMHTASENRFAIDLGSSPCIGAAEGAGRAAGGVGVLGGGLAPGDLAVAAGAHLVAGHDELEVPDLGALLPEHEPADLGAALRGGHVLVAEVELRRAHPHLSHGVHALQPLQRRLPARRRDVLLHDVLGRRRLLTTHARTH
ncbi:Os01g0763850, partial [Oryza sativa Japonica Group]